MTDTNDDQLYQNKLLKAKLHELQRVKQFETGWLKKNHPVIYEDLKKASSLNDERYVTAQMKKFGDNMGKLFGL